MTPLLSVVVPVYNGGPSIVENIEAIRAAVAGPLGDEPFELVVVSDGSIDGTAERLLAERIDGVRVLHYDRNLGKGYAVKAGILASRGAWVGLCDADLDLDPASLPRYLRVAQQEGLDLVIGSKRHPSSIVDYPRSRRVGSWGYQQLNRLLFGLDVRDTQVGLKVMSRAVADEVVPLLLVKQYAFDLELLAVASALGFRRVQEQPIRLEYRFTGSGVRSRAVARALWDTAAVFHRLRILRTYQRKRALITRAVPRHGRPATVSVVTTEPTAVATQDYVVSEVVERASDATAELVAFLPSGARPAGNWLSATVPYFDDPSIHAVVCASLPPLDGPLRERLATAVLESRVGAAGVRDHYLPGNLRRVSDFPPGAAVVRRDAVAGIGATPPGELVRALARSGRDVVYTPETVTIVAPPPAVVPALARLHGDARRVGGVAREARGRNLGVGSAVNLLVPSLLAVGLPLALSGHRWRWAGIAATGLYAGALGASGLSSAVRFRSVAVGLLALPMVVAAQVTFVAGVVRGLVSPR